MIGAFDNHKLSANLIPYLTQNCQCVFQNLIPRQFSM